MLAVVNVNQDLAYKMVWL